MVHLIAFVAVNEFDRRALQPSRVGRGLALKHQPTIKNGFRAALLMAAHLGAGCATVPVSFLPRQDGTSTATNMVTGAVLQSIAKDGTVVSVSPTFGRQGPDRPTFTVRVANASAVPIVLNRNDVRAFFRDRPVALYARAELAAEVRAATVREEAAQVAVGTLAAVAAFWGISTGWNGSIQAGAGSLVVQTPLANWAGGIAIAAAGDEAIRHLGEGEAREAVGSSAILESRTVAAGETATVHILLKDCCSSRLGDDDVIRLEITLAGRAHAFSFQRVAGAEPTKLVGSP